MHPRSKAPGLRTSGLAAAAIAVVLAASCSHRDVAQPGAQGPTVSSAIDPPVAAGLDAVIAAHWRSQGVTAVAAADDLTLLRRATLDLLGRIPTVEELDGFDADTNGDRYERAVDRMLALDEHAQHLAATWSEVMLGSAIKVPPRVLLGARNYHRERFAADAGFDVVTTEMLTFSGEVGEESAAGFLVAHGRRGRVAALAGETARVFLAAQIQCAACHDHPTAPFRQEDFYAFAAHFARTGVKPSRDGDARSFQVVDRVRGQQRLPLPEDPPGEFSGAVHRSPPGRSVRVLATR